MQSVYELIFVEAINFKSSLKQITPSSWIQS